MRATGLCQTHYKQQLRRQKLKPITEKRTKREGTVRYGGLSLTEQCVSVMRARAKRESLAANAVITDILEKWALRRGGGSRSELGTSSEIHAEACYPGSLLHLFRTWSAPLLLSGVGGAGEGGARWQQSGSKMPERCWQPLRAVDRRD